jgi:hypothetical protein
VLEGLEGFEERDGRDREGTQQKDYQVVRAKLSIWQVDQRSNADGEHTEYTKHRGSDSYELHHAGLDV